MLKLAHALYITVGLLAWADGVAAPKEYVDSAAAAQGVATPRKKKLGDVTYRTLWRMQKRVDAMLPKSATLITPVLRLVPTGMAQFERTELQPESWAVAIVGKTIDELVPMRRGGYFALPALPQAQSRGEDAIVMFNTASRRNWFDVGWQVNIPSSGTLRYTQFGQALAEIRHAQSGIPWWDIVSAPEKAARFDAIRVCFHSRQGKILLAGAPAGLQLTPHCALLAFDPANLAADPAIGFAGEVEFVTLDNSASYDADVAM
jgi:hypothetical protein